MKLSGDQRAALTHEGAGGGCVGQISWQNLRTALWPGKPAASLHRLLAMIKNSSTEAAPGSSVQNPQKAQRKCQKIVLFRNRAMEIAEKVGNY